MRANSRQNILLSLGLVGATVFLFSPGLFRSEIPAFRDAYHFYYPQAVWLDRCVAGGELFPSWNASEGLGGSVAGQSSTALYYPLRVIWLLPALSVAQRFSLLIVVHLLIAAAGIHYAARKLSPGGQGGWLAAISYTLSCPVLFQHTNLIYLCSAAWIGFVLGALAEAVSPATKKSTGMSCLVFSTACSMMVLAGDPHTAANALVVAAAAITLRTLWKSWSSKSLRQPAQRFLQLMIWSAAAIALIASATAVQWLPTLRWSTNSSRWANTPVASPEPAQAFQDETGRIGSVLASQPTAHHRIYDFSLPPWHLATSVWPTLGGHYQPNHSRWLDILPTEGRMWIPSIYFGFLPLLFALSALGKPTCAGSRGLLLLAVFSCLASMGNYSFIWQCREGLTGLGGEELAQSLPKDHVGSVYWGLTQIVPGYDAFRFPAKWLVWFAAAGSLLAGLQLTAHPLVNQMTLERKKRSAIFSLISTSGLLFSLAAGLLLLSPSWSQSIDRRLLASAADIWLATPSSSAIVTSTLVAFATPLVSLAAVRYLRSHRRATEKITWLVLAEMTLVSCCWTVFVPAPAPQAAGPPAMHSPAGAPFAVANDQRLVWVDVSEADLVEDGWLASRSNLAERQTDYQNQFLLGKLAVLHGWRNLASAQSIEPALVARLKRWLRRHDDLSENQPELDQVLSQLGVTHRLVRRRSDDAPAEFLWHPVQGALPLCRCMPLEKDTAEWTCPVDWRWINSSELEVTVASSGPSRLIVGQFNDGGWIATRWAEDSESRPVLLSSFDHLFLAARIPAGRWKISFRRKRFW